MDSYKDFDTMEKLATEDLEETGLHYLTDYDIIRICDMTDLSMEDLKLCWSHVWTPAIKENGKVDFENFMKYFCTNLEVICFIRIIISNMEVGHGGR